METADLILNYFIRTLPALIVCAWFIFFLGKGHVIIRIFAYLFVFVVMRDVMTPLKFWRLGSEGLFWLRTIDNPVALNVLSILSILSMSLLILFDKEASETFVFRKGSLVNVLASGIGGAICIALPMFVIYQFVPIVHRGGPTELGLASIGALLVFCLSVNFLEEGLYRGFFQGYMERTVPPARAAILSGLLFGLSHTFLAITVSDAGWGVVAFTSFEGIIAGFVRARAGVIASTITHGLAIFPLCAGLF
ncbi:MAG: CPBP family intramembrane metalloprotease [Leptospirales bacterium]|nr:CPBP family intramembrane metalloprotease [Leptospirales bacterium]